LDHGGGFDYLNLNIMILNIKNPRTPYGISDYALLLWEAADSGEIEHRPHSGYDDR
jgi:hypothetical protein